MSSSVRNRYSAVASRIPRFMPQVKPLFNGFATIRKPEETQNHGRDFDAGGTAIVDNEHFRRRERLAVERVEGLLELSRTVVREDDDRYVPTGHRCCRSPARGEELPRTRLYLRPGRRPRWRENEAARPAPPPAAAP